MRCGAGETWDVAGAMDTGKDMRRKCLCGLMKWLITHVIFLVVSGKDPPGSFSLRAGGEVSS